MKRIAVDARPLSSKLTGIGRYLNKILYALLEQDNANQYFLYSTQPLLHDFSLYKNVQTRTLNSQNKLSDLLYSQTFFPLWALQDGIDTYWSPRHHLPLLLFFSKTMRKAVTVHDIVWLRHPETMSRGGLLVEKLLFKPSMALADSILLLSDFTKNEMKAVMQLPEDKLGVTGVGCFSPMSSLQETKVDATGRVLLFVGTVEPRKNLHNILIAFKEIAESLNDVTLVIVGKAGWGNLQLLDLIRELKLENRVKVLGFVSDDDLVSLYGHCEALLMPSIYEGFGFPALEALSFRKKVLVSKHCAIATIEGENIFITETDSESIALSLKILLDSKPTRYAHIATGWDVPAQKTLKLLP